MKKKSWFFKKGSSETPHLLNFDQTNLDFLGVDFPNLSTYKTFTGEFYMDIDFEYSALDSSYAILIGKLSLNSSLRLLVNPTVTLVSYNQNSNMSYSKATSMNTKYNIRISRDASNDCFISYDGETPVNIGNRAGDVSWNTIAYAQRYLTGKIYRFNINGEEFPLNEGSGDIITGSQGTVLPIQTSNAGGLTYINDTMWEAI